jgi:hypothetical protein
MNDGYDHTNDRRQVGRVSPVQRIRGTIGKVTVYVIDLSVAGLRVAHQDELPREGSKVTLVFDWQGLRFIGVCTLVYTRVAKAAKTQFEKALHHSGLLLESKDELSTKILRDIVQDCVTRALDEQKANAQGIPAIAAQSVQTGGVSDEFIRCEFRGGRWSRTKTKESRQPEQGFTVGANEVPARIDMLCRAYESGDEEGRRLIRTFAAMSISKSEGIPTRRYAP